MAAYFDANGYDRVSPPLVEFESTLLAGMGAATADRIFRMVDPMSQRTLGIRADVTAQIARLASTRLQSSQRPLRLMYAGQVLRVKGHQLRPERQFTQVGFELVGPDSVAADSEAIIVAAEAVSDLGIKEITVDLALPPLVPSILQETDYDDITKETLYAALNHKDAAEIRKISADFSDTLTALIEASGPLESARVKMSTLKLPVAGVKHLETFFAVADKVKAEAPDLTLTADFVENRGLQYHTGVTFFLFAKGSSREIGRGGRYLIDHGEGRTEAATGATLFIDTLMPVSPKGSSRPCLYVAFDTGRDAISKLRADGFRVRASLSADTDNMANAIRLDCSHMLQNGAILEVSNEGSSA